MLGDQWFGIVFRAFEEGQIILCSHISQSDTNVAKETAALNPFNGRIAKKSAESGLIKL